jgi:hypothetical protein
VLNNTATPGITDTGTLTLTNTATGAVGTSFNNDGIDATSAANVTNYGSITGLNAIRATTANVTNFGTMTGSEFGVYTAGDITVTNSGTISGQSTAGVLSLFGSAAVTNSGTITGGNFGVAAGYNVSLVNSGTVAGLSYGVYSNAGNVTLSNSGTISQTQGIAFPVPRQTPPNINLSIDTNRSLLGLARRSTLICCLSTRISASSAACDRNRSLAIPKISRHKSSIGDQHRAILGQLPT